MHVWNVRRAARCKYRTQKIAILAPSHNFVWLYLMTSMTAGACWLLQLEWQSVSSLSPAAWRHQLNVLSIYIRETLSSSSAHPPMTSLPLPVFRPRGRITERRWTTQQQPGNLQRCSGQLSLLPSTVWQITSRSPSAACRVNTARLTDAMVGWRLWFIYIFVKNSRCELASVYYTT